MKLLWVFLTCCVLAISGPAANSDTLSALSDMVGDDALTSGLAASLGIDSEQAGGGLGSILSLAQNKLPTADYDSLAGYLPGADKYLKMAKDAGVLTDPITDMGRLNSAMEALGIDAATASKLYDQLGSVVGQAGGDSAKEMLSGLLQ